MVECEEYAPWLTLSEVTTVQGAGEGYLGQGSLDETGKYLSFEVLKNLIAIHHIIVHCITL